MLFAKPYQIHALVKLLTQCGDKLEMVNHPLWIIAARGAAALDSMLIHGHHNDGEIAGELNAAADSLNSDTNLTIGLAFRLASVWLDAFRLGLVTLDRRPAPRWVGVDMAKPGTDRHIERMPHA